MSTGAVADVSLQVQPNLPGETMVVPPVQAASPTHASTGPESPNSTFTSTSAAAESPVSSANHAVDVKIDAVNADGTEKEGVPQVVSESAQEAAANAKYESEQTGFWRQNLAKLRRNLCGPLHLGDALWTAWILLWIIVTGSTKGDLKYFWLFLFLLFYLSYLHFNWKSDECAYLRNCMDVGAFEAQWRTFRATNPTITLRTESWHWERRVHSNTTYHAGGGSTTTTTVTYVRRVTHEEESVFNYRVCEDLSLDVAGSDLQQQDATFVHLYKEYSFGTMETALAYLSQFQALKSRNQSRDAFMDSFELIGIPGWTPRVGIYLEGKRPILMYFPIFALSCVCLLSWPMKLYLEWVSKKGTFTMTKRLTL